jgi:protocatechuate 3,4-dioxygenase beta subunit
VDKPSDAVTKPLSRREAIGALGALGAAVVTGCSSPTAATELVATTEASGTSAAAASGSCVVTPQETVGPYPNLTDLFRSDVTEGKPGLPLSLSITVVNANNLCAPVAGANVEIWQCDAEGRYSQYSQPGYDGRNESFLRGIQTTDASGRVTFRTVYPGWYQGRATHIHVEVVLNGRSIKVTQIAFPEDVTAAVYANGVYAAKGQNPTRNATDNVFADGVQSQLASLSGSPTSGYTATFTLGVAV